jgi:hypothetical protein
MLPDHLEFSYAEFIGTPTVSQRTGFPANRSIEQNRAQR